MAAKKILVSLDFTKNQIQNAVAHVLASDPSSPSAGQFYYDSTNLLWKYYNGTAFVSDTDRSRHTGTQLAATISNFDTAVRTSRLDQMAAPTADVSMGGFKITNLATPTASTDAATLAYVDSRVAGLSWKDEVRVATTANGTLATAYENGDVLDGVTLATGDRILLKDQTTGADNGIYTVNASGAPTRATDADSGAEMKGAAVFVSEGTANGGTRWVCNNTGTITIGSTSLTFANFGGGSSYTAGNGLTLSGSDFNVGAGTGITVNTNDVAVDTAVVVRKYTATIGDGSTTSIAVTHSLGTQDITYSIRDATTNAFVDCDVVATSTTVATFIFTTAPASSAYKVVIHG